MINQQKNKPSLYFFTISFPPAVSDNLAYKILNSSLTSLRTTSGLKKYIWIAERQKIGTIHYHIATPNLINVTYFNSVVRNLIIHYIRKKQVSYSLTAAAKYNGVDIGKDRNTRKVINYARGNSKKAIAGYLTKYITKSQTEFNRQAWQCSKEVSALYTDFHLTLDEAERMLLQYIDRDNPVIIDTHFCFYGWLKEPPPVIQALISDINNIGLN